MSSTHGDRDESMYAGEGRTGKQENPAHRRSARGKAAGVIVGVVLAIFLVLLAVWLLGSASDGEEGGPSESMGAATAAVVLASG